MKRKKCVHPGCRKYELKDEGLCEEHMIKRYAGTWGQGGFYKCHEDDNDLEIYIPESL